jgi:hypothetical protein
MNVVLYTDIIFWINIIGSILFYSPIRTSANSSGFLEVLVLLFKNLWKYHICDYINLCSCCLLFLFLAPDSDAIVSQPRPLQIRTKIINQNSEQKLGHNINLNSQLGYGQGRTSRQQRWASKRTIDGRGSRAGRTDRLLCSNPIEMRAWGDGRLRGADFVAVDGLRGRGNADP